MDAFWTYARWMLRYRWAVAGCFALATVSALSLSIGLLGASPVLEAILGRGKGLPELARDVNDLLARGRFGSLLAGARIPDAAIASLPEGKSVALAWIAGSLAFLTIVGSLANFGHAYLSLTVVNRTITRIRHRLFHAVVRAPISRVVSRGASESISRIINDTNQLAGGFTQLLSRAVIQIFKGVAGLAAALWYDWRVTAAALLAVPALYTIIRKLGKRIRRASGAALESQQELLALTTQSLQGLKVVKVNTAERLEGGRFHAINKRVLRELNRVRTARALASPLTEMLSIFLLLALILVAARLIGRGTIEAGPFVLVLSSLGVAGASLKPLTGIIADIQASEPAARRIDETLRAAPEPGHGIKMPRLPRHHRSIRFDNVTFTYPGAPEPALCDITLDIPFASRVAIVGTNGSGKTTLLGLIPRLYDPDSGRVLIDGVDIAGVGVRTLRAQIGVVTQETVLFKGTVRENIAYGAEGVTDRAIEDAARRARAHEFIARLPGAYDAPVAEQGLTLSGGQRQRIAIARAILRDPAILVLDEATSMIDAESEQAIAQALDEFRSGRTTIVVAHRITTVVQSDSIVVLDAGRIIDQGTHDQLTNRCPLYQRLVRTQLLSDA